MKNKRVFVSVVLIAGAISLTGCPPKKKIVLDQEKIEEKSSEKETVKEESGTDVIEITQEWSDIPSLGNALFAFDRSTLSQSQRKILTQNVKLLKKLPSTIQIRVEGHCDQQGTVEYNVALGQRRSNAVRLYYKTSGIDPGRIKTISFGEERPLCQEEAESCWRLNRRSATKIRSAEPITIQTEGLFKEG